MLLSDFLLSPVVTGRAPVFAPPTDVVVAEGDVVVTMDVPGVAPDSLQIELIDDEVVVRGERTRASVAEGAQWAHSERAFGRFERRIRVPSGVDADRITASVDAGVLSLIVPRPERLKPRRIAIDVGEEQRELETTTA